MSGIASAGYQKIGNYGYDGYLVALLKHLQEAVANKWDGVVLVDGIEGSGKSTLTFACAYYLDPSFSLDAIVFTPEQFMEAVDKAKPGTAIVWDEFVTGGLSDDYMSNMQKALIKKVTMIRKKRLYLFWVLPYFFMARTYFAVARSRFLLHSATPDGIKRGYWEAWNYERKKDMYFKGKKTYDYCVPPYRRGKFGDFFKEGIIDEHAYDVKKEAAILSLTDSVDGRKQEGKFKVVAAKAVTMLSEDSRLTQTVLADELGVHRHTIMGLLKLAKKGVKSEM